MELGFWADDWPIGVRASERRTRAPLVAAAALGALGADLARELARLGTGRVVAIAPGGAWAIAVELGSDAHLDAMVGWLAARTDVPRSTTVTVAGSPPRPLHARMRDY